MFCTQVLPGVHHVGRSSPPITLPASASPIYCTTAGKQEQCSDASSFCFWQEQLACLAHIVRLHPSLSRVVTHGSEPSTHHTACMISPFQCCEQQICKYQVPLRTPFLAGASCLLCSSCEAAMKSFQRCAAWVTAFQRCATCVTAFQPLQCLHNHVTAVGQQQTCSTN